MKAISSNATLVDAKRVVQYNKIINQGYNFDVYEVPSSISRFKAYALLLFKEMHDFGEGNVPKGTMIIPINVYDRQGYFIDRNIARDYS